MSPRKSSTPVKSSPVTGSETVDAFLDALDSPSRREMQALRTSVLKVDPRITEGIKWNAPSFRFKEWFATFNVRGKGVLMIVFHRGAKVRDGTGVAAPVPDPTGLVEWLSPDRCVARFCGLKDIEARRAAFQEFVRHWIRGM